MCVSDVISLSTHLLFCAFFHHVTFLFHQAVATKFGDQLFETDKEPLVLTLPAEAAGSLPLVIIQCRGHYGEPTFQLECPPVGSGKVIYRMAYQVLARKSWEVAREE